MKVCEQVCLHRAIIDKCGCSDTIEIDGPRCQITNTTQGKYAIKKLKFNIYINSLCITGVRLSR